MREKLEQNMSRLVEVPQLTPPLHLANEVEMKKLENGQPKKQ